MSRKKKGGRSAKSYSGLDQHQRKGKVLAPPFRRLGTNVSFSSWFNERLPNLLWAALLASALDRDEALEIFRGVAGTARALGKDVVKAVDHTALGLLSDAQFDSLIAPVLEKPSIREALSPLLMFSKLPDRHHWSRHLKERGAQQCGNELAAAIAATFDHQSQESTDCRWLRLLVLVVTERMLFPPQLAHLAQEILDYPNSGDQRSVRPSIRASEMALDAMSEEKPQAWPEEFWGECFEMSDCIPVRTKPPEKVASEVWKPVIGAYAAVGQHAREAQTKSVFDARYDAAFGLVLYALALVGPLLRNGGQYRAEGRLVLRTLVESYITFAFLLKKDDPTIWQKYRAYGQGQAKLTFLKLDEIDPAELPSYVSISDLERYANEDIWQEYTSIDLGHWAGSDLRKMSEEAGVKAIYDKYYAWPSAYVHANWPSVREAVFDQCLNPLHRFHRIPSPPNFALGSVEPDLISLLNLHLDGLNKAYPPLKVRIPTTVAAAQDRPSEERREPGSDPHP